MKTLSQKLTELCLYAACSLAVIAAVTHIAHTVLFDTKACEWFVNDNENVRDYGEYPRVYPPVQIERESGQ